MIDNESVDTVIVDDIVRQRRGRGGRLYHGETAVDFYGRRWWGLGISGLLLVISLGSIIFSGLNLSLDFKGGVSWEVPSKDLTEADARAVLADNGIDGATAKVQVLTNADTGLRTLEVQVGEQTDAVRQKVQQAFATKVGASRSPRRHRGHLRDRSRPRDGGLRGRYHQPARAQRRDRRCLYAGDDSHLRAHVEHGGRRAGHQSGHP